MEAGFSQIQSQIRIHISQEKINISACVNGIPYINGAREMGVHEWIASVM